MEWNYEEIRDEPNVVLNLPIVSESGVVTGYEKSPIMVEDSSYRLRNLMGEHTLNLQFKMPGYKNIPIGTYCDYQNERYTLEAPENITKRGERHFVYDLVMQSDQHKLTKFILRNIVPGDRRLKFSYTARPEEFLRLLIENMNERDPVKGWSFDKNHIESAEKTVSFNHNSCMDALKLVAEAFETEWEIKGKTISLRKVEYFKGNALKLSYGRGNGFLPGLGRSEYSDVKPVERLFVNGGERNIDSSTYRKNESTGQVVSRELLLPASKSIKFDGIRFEGEVGFEESRAREYITDKDGFSVCRADKVGYVGLIEGSLDCSHIYPMREGEVAKVVVVDKDKHFYDFTDSDSNIPDYKEHLIAGETMTVIFQSGMLAGREFDVKYKHKGHFEIVPQTLDGLEMPDEYYKPKVGDVYGVFNVSLPNSYIEEAEMNMLKEAVKYLYEYEEPRFTFTGTVDGIWAKRNWTNIGGWMVLGGYIHFSDTQFMPEGIDIRIVSIKDYVNNPYKPEIELSNKAQSGSWLHNMQRQVDVEEVVTDTKDREVVQYAKRRFRNVRETMEMLSESMLDFSEGIRPMFVNTMQLVAGDESLQFDYVPAVSGALFRFDSVRKMMIAPRGRLTHKTLGIDFVSSDSAKREYLSWSMPDYSSAVLDNAGKRYYLYAKAPTKGTTGGFVLSEKAIEMNGVAGYYHLLVGLLNSEFEGDREFVPLYGFTEILPGRITADLIKSADGNSYLNLKRAQMLLADKGYTKGMDWNITQENQLTLKGFVNAVAAQIGGFTLDNDKFESLEGRKIGSKQTPNILLTGKDGSGHLAAGEINWDQQGSFNAGIFEVPYREGMVLVRGVKSSSGATMGNIIITNREVGEISTSLDYITGKKRYEQTSVDGSSQISEQNIVIAETSHKAVAPLKQLVIYSIDVNATADCNVSADAGGEGSYALARVVCRSRVQALVNGEVVYDIPLSNFSIEATTPDNPLSMDTAQINPTLVIAANNGDTITIRIFASNLGVNSGKYPLNDPLAKGVANLSASLSVDGSSIVRETIIGSDGVLIRQDENNEFVVRRDTEKNELAFQIKGLPTSPYNLNSGQIWRKGEELKIVP